MLHNEKEVIWIKLHEGNKQQAIQLNKLRSWTYMSEKHANERKQLLKVWQEFEEQSGRETNTQPENCRRNGNSMKIERDQLGTRTGTTQGTRKG